MSENKPYAVDALINTVRVLGKKGPVFFQRDGEFYVATPYCFGKIGLGLITSPNETHSEYPEILNSESVITKRNENELPRPKGTRYH